MGLEKLTPKQFKRYKDIIDFLATFDLTIEDLLKLKELKVYRPVELNNDKETEEEQKASVKKQMELKKAIEKPTTPSDVMEVMFGGESEAFRPNAR